MCDWIDTHNKSSTHIRWFHHVGLTLKATFRYPKNDREWSIKGNVFPACRAMLVKGTQDKSHATICMISYSNNAL